MDFFTYMTDYMSSEFEPVRDLKQGPRGQVRLMRHKGSGKAYVFRLFQGDAGVYRRLLDISCPHLPQIMEVAEQEGTVAVLEEYVQGETIAQLLEEALFSPREVRQTGRELCLSLSVLHSLGAVHRDIKPENVILRATGAVLIDFDASRMIKDHQESDTRILGTTGYAAPEQYGISQTDGRADIYALGVLMNVMLTGQHPSVALAKGRLGRIISRCTMMSPQKRYDSVEELMRVL